MRHFDLKFNHARGGGCCFISRMAVVAIAFAGVAAAVVLVPAALVVDCSSTSVAVAAVDAVAAAAESLPGPSNANGNVQLTDDDDDAGVAGKSDVLSLATLALAQSAAGAFATAAALFNEALAALADTTRLRGQSVVAVMEAEAHRRRQEAGDPTPAVAQPLPPASLQLDQLGHDELRARLTLGLAEALVQLDEFASALEKFETVLRMDLARVDIENVIKGSALAGYAVALTKVQRFNQAVRVAKQAVSIAETMYGSDHENTLTSRFNLGAVYEAKGDMPAARATLEAVLVDRRRIQAHGGILDDMQLAGTLSALADVRDHQGESQEALALLVEAVQICFASRNAPRHRVTVASVYNNYGLVLQHLGFFDEAAQVYQQTLLLQEALRGRNHSSTATTMFNLATVEVFRGGDTLLSRRLVNEVLQILTHSHGQHHEWTKEVAAFNTTLYR
eukprot:INCI2657.2.p1 GENE.INCI2657.2~~INCI2657.2.p1  ORF type:complete len:449 (+),score=99.45 INCI2657.2:166-1512(+)